MQHYALPTGRQYWQPPAPTITAPGGPEAFFTGPTIKQLPAPLYYPGGRKTGRALQLGGLGGLADVNLLQLSGAIGGGLMGAMMTAVLTSVLPKRLDKWGTIIGIGFVPAMAIAGWMMFKEGFTYEFTEEEVTTV